MYKINERLAVHGFDWDTKKSIARNINDHEYDPNNYGVITDPKFDRTGQFIGTVNKIWVVVDCRSLLDDWANPTEKYRDLILRGISFLNEVENVVCCCSAGQSRSNVIALGILMEYFNINFYDAWELIRAKNPLCNIAMQHLDAIKEIYDVKLP